MCVSTDVGYLAVQQECVLRDFITVSLGSFLHHCCDLMSAQLWISLTLSTAKKRQLDDESKRPIDAAIRNLAYRGPIHELMESYTAPPAGTTSKVDFRFLTQGWAIRL